MTDSSDLMTIGQFSSLARISVRMLRHYDEHGVLVPAAVGEWAGYRRYASSQLGRAIAIRMLRDVGFDVSAISTLLAAQGTPAYAHALAMKRVVLEDDLRAARQRLTQLDRLVANLKDTTMTISLETKTYPAATVGALRDTGPSYDSGGLLWERLMPELARQGITPGELCGATNHDLEYQESDVDTSVWVGVPGGTSVAPPLQVVELPEHQAAVATLVGPFSGIPAAVDALSRHMAEHGQQPTGPLSTRYLSDIAKVAADELVTELSFPIS